jgi:DNA polymerase-3 subunit beta
MRFSVQVGVLKGLCSKLIRIIPKTSPGNPTLLLTALEGRVEGLGTSSGYAITWKTQVAAQILEAGTIGVSAHDFAKVIAALPADQQVQVTANVGDTRVEVKSGKSVFRVPLIEEAGYPIVPSHDLQDFATLSVEPFKTALKGMLFAVADSPDRGLNGLFWHCLPNGYSRLVGTDGTRLSYQEFATKTGFVLPQRTLFPADAMQILLSALEGNTEVKMQMGKSYARFTVGENQIQMRLLVAEFPNYEQVIPPKCSGSFRFSMKSSELKGVLQRVSVFSTAQNGMRLELEANRITCISRALDKGEAREVIDVPLETTTKKVIGVNVTYLMDVLNTLGEQDVTIETNGELQPILVYTGEAGLHILMPLRLD